MTARLLSLAIVVAACNTPAPSLRLQLAGPPSQACPSTNCADVPMTCASVMSVRFVDPANTETAYLRVCQEVPIGPKPDLCSLASVNLPSDNPVPVRDLAVEVAIYPKSVIPLTDTGDLACPTKVHYDDSGGFPVAVVGSGSTDPLPAVGGRAFYHPGDTEIIVTLGCTDVGQLADPSCAGAMQLAVTATVEDFEALPLSVSQSTGDKLTVSVGEPMMTDTGTFALESANARLLPRTVVGPAPVWSGNVDLTFVSTACIEVLEDGAQTTTSLNCGSAGPTATAIDIAGVRLPKTTLEQVLGAISQTSFPDAGLTVGIVLDYLGNPSVGSVVTTSNANGTAGTVQYLSADRSGLIAGGTSSSGMFVSEDASFGTTFSTSGNGLHEVDAIGGLVDGKVTVVVLQFEQPTVSN